MAGSEFEDRLLTFSVNVIAYLKSSKIHRSIIDQLIRSATSKGANYTEANNASSKQDFRNKIFIAKKEASESRYWLKLIQKSEGSDQILEGLIDEVSQLILILQKIVTTLGRKKMISEK